MDRRPADWLHAVGLAIGLLVSMAALPAGAHHEEEAIQPGDEMLSPSRCSFNFVFEDTDGHRYIGTAAHCVDAEGQTVIAEDPWGPLGTVAWIPEQADFALVYVYPDHQDDLDPSVRHWGGPTGVQEATQSAPGDRILHYGYGTGVETSEITRPRTGILTEQRASIFCADAGVVGGDSGGPVLTEEGKALGVVTRVGVNCLPATNLQGPTVEHVLTLASEEGLDLELVEGEFREDTVHRETDRLVHACGPACGG